nr:tmv resistance protein n [Quercus suber]
METEAIQCVDVNISGCSKLESLPENVGNSESIEKLDVSRTAIREVPSSIGHLTSLALLGIRDCKSLTCLPSTIFNLKLLKYVNISGCSKLERLPEILGNVESVEELDVSGTAIREVPSSIGCLKNLKVLSFSGCKGLSSFQSTSWYDFLPFSTRPKSPNPVGLSSLSSLCSLTKLDLSNCDLKAIPNDIGCFFSLKEIDLSENSFVCLPDSISQLCKLRKIVLEDCKSLQSLPKLPLSITEIWGHGCTSLETLPGLLKPDSLCEAVLYFSNCGKLANNEGVIDIFFAVIRKHLQGLSLEGRFDHKYFDRRYDIIIPGSVIPKWFSYQSIGRTVGLSDHSWLLYLLPQYEEKIKLLKECEGNEFSQIGIKIKIYGSKVEVKKCGLRMVYKKDIEVLNHTMAQSSNTNIIPYEDLGVHNHNFDNSAVVAEGNKAKRTRYNYDGAEPSGEGSSNDVPHPKRIERLAEFMAHGDSDCEEYFECGEEHND